MNEQNTPQPDQGQPGQGQPWGSQPSGASHPHQGPQWGNPPSGQATGPGQQGGGRPAYGGQPAHGGQQGGSTSPLHQGHQGGGQQPGGPTGPMPQGQPGSSFGQPTGAGASAPQGQQFGAATPAAPVAGNNNSMSSGDILRLVLHILALLLVVLGISIDMDGRDSGMWSDTWTWAGFATLMALAQGAAMLPKSALSGAGWTVGAIGAGGLLLFWTLLMLPMIGTNMAFMVTLGTACATATVLLSPDRKI